jgi:radical SAM superfamily enzyme YgiQ (UPF0313 family)
MKITFVTPTPLDLAAFGVRSLSAFLKQEGIDVRNVFLPGGVGKYKYRSGYAYRYDESLLEQVVSLCRGSDLIGISVMSNYFERAIQLTAAIKSTTGKPVIWGGIHATVMPEESLQYADMVCIGEGEYALLELLGKMEAGADCTHVENIWLKRNGAIVRNPLRALENDLDRFPFFDFGLEDQFIYDPKKRSVVPMSKELLQMSFPLEPHLEGTFSDSYRRTVSYKTMTTRGCPHACSFCAEKTLAELYKGQRYLRKRSTGHVIRELEWVKRELPFVESIFLFDDTFLSRSTDDIVEFSRVYKERIALPFHIQASPLTLTEEKMEALVDAGLAFVEMGIQSTSKAGKELYNRNVSNDRLLKSGDVLSRYSDVIYPPCYHVILDNPWEKTEDVLETLGVVLKLPRPYWLKRASLVCFPGTELFLKAKEEGILKTDEDLRREIYNKHLHQPKGSYVNFLMYLAGFCNFPRWILKLLSRKELVGLLDKPSFSNFFFSLNRFGDGCIIASKGIRSLIKGDFKRIGRYINGLASKMS